MALSMARAATTEPLGSNDSLLPSTPLRESSSSGRAAITEIRTPAASSSFLDNDSPLPSPPSIFKSAYRPLQSHNSDFGALQKTSDEDDEDKENVLPARTTSASPTPASAPLRSKGRHSGDEDGSKNGPVSTSQRSPRAKSLAEALGAPAPPSSVSNNRHALEHKLGIRPLAGSGRTAALIGARSVSHASGASLLARDKSSESPVSFSRATVSHARIASHGDHVEGRPSRPLPSAAYRSRDGTEEKARSNARDGGADEAVSRKRRSPEEAVAIQNGLGTSDGGALSGEQSDVKAEYNGKLSGGSDSGERSSSPQHIPAISMEGRQFSYATPALAAGARSMRSAQTATAGRSTGRTLRRYGVGEARPMHVRPARVMMVQGADDTDGEDEEDNGGADAAAMKAASLNRSGESNRGSLKEEPSSAEGTPRSQASSKALDGISTQATKADSPLTRDASDAVDSRDRARTDSGARRRRLLPEVQGSRQTASARLTARAPTDDKVARKVSAETEANDLRAPGRSLGSDVRQANADAGDRRTPRETSSIAGKSANRVDAQTRPGDVKQAGDELLGPSLPALPPLERARGTTQPSSSTSSRPARQVTPPAGRTDVVDKALPRVIDQPSPGVDRAQIAELEPEIEAEKRRLLELNGWDRYVHAALEEGQRQRHNGCQFAEHPVGKVLASQKETKFRGAKYLKVSRAGEGGFSTVFQVVGPVAIPTLDGGFEAVPPELQAHFAMKQVSLKKLEQSSRDELLQEAELLETLAQVDESDKYVLRYFGHKHSGDTLKILMELGEMDFNTLLRTQHPLSRQALSEYWKQMLEAVHFVHNAKLVHSDLKPANFLMVKGRIKLIDFGIAQKIPLGTVHISRDVIVGTPNYMAPEAIQKARRGGHGVYKAGKPSDVWSLGCILYQMIYGRTPFAHISGDRKLEVITNPKHTIAFPNRRTLDDPPQQISNGDAKQDDEKDNDAEELDEILINCVKSALVYDSQLRAKIPQLLDHLFVRDEVTLSRKRLKSIVFRIKSYMQQGRLTDDNVDVIADRLVTNLQLDGFRPFDPEQD